MIIYGIERIKPRLLAELISVKDGLCELTNNILSKEELDLMIVDVCIS